MPTASPASFLIGFEHALWLAALPLAALPFLLEWLKPRTWRPAPAGWGIETGLDFVSRKYNRFFKAALQSLAAIFLVLALAGPKWPVLGLLQPATKGHRWAVVLDCSGSMGQVDPGSSESRLKRLTTALAQAVARRPNDQFTIVRLAGFADRLGPATSNAAFLQDVLENLRPALPGEDGTSLGDGLVLAAESLKPTGQPAAYQTILLISDGRENRPDASAKPLAEIVPLLLKLKLRVDWLRVEMPAPENESPESRRLGDASRLLLESLVEQSGGTVQSLKTGDNWADLTRAALGPMPLDAAGPHAFNSAACACLILAILAWVIFVMIQTGLLASQFRWRGLSGVGILLPILLVIALASHFSNENRKTEQAHPVVKHRTLFLMDVSPSMAARDASDGSRLKSACRLARGMLQRLSLDDKNQAGVIAFSGRAVGLSPWTSDWTALENTIEELQPDRIAPTGSSWESAMRVALDYYFKGDAASGTIQNDIVMITDGEASKEPAPESIQALRGLNVPVHCITLGSDRPPGMLFRTRNDEPLWLDRSTNQPARSMRHDMLAQQTSQGTGGKFMPVGTSRFDAFQLATSLFGKANVHYSASPQTSGNGRLIAIVGFWLWAFGEFLKMVQLLLNRPPVNIAVACMLASLLSCGPPGNVGGLSAALNHVYEEYQAGRRFQAEAMLLALQMQYPNEPVIAYNMGLLKLGQGENQAALAFFQVADAQIARSGTSQAQSSHLLSSRTIAARGFIQLQSGDYAQAVKSYETALQSCEYLPEIECANLQANMQFARDRLKPDNRANANTGPTAPTPPDGMSSKTARLETPSEQLETLASQARGRARTARSLFDPAGDEILKPSDSAKHNRRMNW